MRALLIVNPHATSTNRGRRDVIVRALASAVDLEVVQTRYRGDATKLAAAAVADRFGLVMTLGGDGTVNEAVNGLLGGASSPAMQCASAGTDDGSRAAAGSPPPARRGASGTVPAAGPAAEAATQHPAAAPTGGAADLPALAALPGGNANVFIRSLSLPDDPVEAAARLIEDLAGGKERRIGVGCANGRYFTFNAGLGLDAEVVRAVDGRRAHGRTLTPALFAVTALRQYYQVTDRRRPAIRITEPVGRYPDAVFLCIVSNSAPWTYLGRRPVYTSPDASFDTGLDLIGFRSLGTVTTLRTLRQMLADRKQSLRGRNLVSGHDLDVLVVKADRPVAFQLDGEYMGEVEQVTFRSVPEALRVIGLCAKETRSRHRAQDNEMRHNCREYRQ